MFKRIKAYFTKKKWEKLLATIKNKNIPLIDRVYLCLELNENIPELTLQDCFSYYTKAPSLSLQYMIYELEQCRDQLLKSGKINLITSVDNSRIRLDSWVLLNPISEYNKDFNIKEGILYATEIIKTINENTTDGMVNYISGKCAIPLTSYIEIIILIGEIQCQKLERKTMF